MERSSEADVPTTSSQRDAKSQGLNDSLMRRMKCTTTFPFTLSKTVSMDFSADGLVMMAVNDKQIVDLYSMNSGDREESVRISTDKYGVGIIRFGGNPNFAIHSCTKIDNKLRYLDLYQNSYLRYFPGHTARVSSLHVNPAFDTFASSGEDKTVRLWDQRASSCQACLEIPAMYDTPVANFDPSGEVLLVAVAANSLKMYDIRKFNQGPFVEYTYKGFKRDVRTVGLEVSPDRKHILQNTDKAAIRVIDYMEGTELRVLRGHENKNRERLEASFSPDGKYISSASSDSHLYSWRVNSGALIAKIPTSSSSQMKACRWSPCHAILATGCSQLRLWSVPQKSFPRSLKEEEMAKEQHLVKR